MQRFSFVNGLFTLDHLPPCRCMSIFITVLALQNTSTKVNVLGNYDFFMNFNQIINP